MELMALGFAMWYATGIDDALIFGGIVTRAKNQREKLEATYGLVLAFTLMCTIVIFVGGTLTATLDLAVLGITIRDIVTCIVLWFVVKLGWEAWKESSAEGQEGDEDSVDANTYQNVIERISMRSPKFSRDAFKGFALNCLDDITVNTANIIDKDYSEIIEYMGGVTLGITSMILCIWFAQLQLQTFSERYGQVFHRVRAVGIWFAAGLIFHSWIVSSQIH
jgi:hypothetical protein